VISEALYAGCLLLNGKFSHVASTCKVSGSIAITTNCLSLCQHDIDWFAADFDGPANSDYSALLIVQSLQSFSAVEKEGVSSGVGISKFWRVA
jgi:hypothetical protein